VIQSTSVFTVHEHSRLIVIVNRPLAPVAGTLAGSALNVAAHGDAGDSGAVTLVDDVVQLVTKKRAIVIERQRMRVRTSAP